MEYYNDDYEDLKKEIEDNEREIIEPLLNVLGNNN